MTYDLDFSAEEIRRIFRLTKEMKEKLERGEPHEYLKNKSLAMIFQKPSTRTRVSFETAMTQLGGHALNLSPNDLQLSRGETIADTSRVLSRYCDAIMARVFSHRDIVDLAKNAAAPVINGLSDEFHPCQALTDIYSVWEKLGFPEKFPKHFTMAFVGDGDNNVTNSLLLLAGRLGINFRVGCPKKYETRRDILVLAGREAAKNGAKIEMTNDPRRAVKNADVVYTDVWVSMGRSDAEERKTILKPYRVNRKLLGFAGKGAWAMHCLPAHRGEEITDEVMDGPQSIVFDQAENRLHVQKAILVFLIKKTVV